jgi:hypothetical protein
MSSQEMNQILSTLKNLNENVIGMKSDIAALKNDAALIKLIKSDVTTLKTDVDEVKQLQGRLYEEAMHAGIEKEFGWRFARSFTVRGVRGLARLVTDKTRTEDDVDAQTQNEERLLMDMYSKCDIYVASLRSVAKKADAPFQCPSTTSR